MLDLYSMDLKFCLLPHMILSIDWLAILIIVQAFIKFLLEVEISSFSSLVHNFQTLRHIYWQNMTLTNYS